MVLDLLSSDHTLRDGAIVAAMYLAKNLNKRGIDALGIAIREKLGDLFAELPRTHIHVALCSESAWMKAHDSILEIARRHAICREAEDAGRIMEKLRAENMETSSSIKALLSEIRQVGGDDQVHEFQLVGTYWKAIYLYDDASDVPC
jgi:hypothetical protein